MAKWTPWVGLFYDDTWHDVSADVYERDPINIRWGKADETSAPVPTQITMTMNNRTGAYNPRNPMSPLYGKVGRNTPLQVGFDPVTEDFEDTSYNFTWGFAGTGSWARSSTQAHAGTWSFKSPALADGQTNSWQVNTSTGANTVSFWHFTDISSSSFFAVYTSEGLQWFTTGNSGGWQFVTVDVGSSNYVLFSYQRVSSGGTNAVYVDDLRMVNARGTGEVTTWATDTTDDWNPTTGKGDAWTKVTAGGLLRRLNQASDPLRSPIYRAVTKQTAVTPVVYWPCEDPDGSSQAASGVGGEPMRPVTTVRYTLPDGTALTPGGAPRFASGAGVTGSDKLPTFTEGGTLAGAVPKATYSGYAVDWVMQFSAGAADGATTADVFGWRENGTYVHYTVNVTSTAVTVSHANPAADATLSASGSCVATINVFDGTPHHFRYQIVQSGGNYQADFYIDGTFYATATNFTPPMAGTLGRPTMVEWNPGEDRGDYMPIAAGHVIVWPVGTGQPDIFTPTAGYPGEQASTRLQRIADEEGWPVAVRDLKVNTTLMGPQGVQTIGDMLKQIERTEDGLLTDQRGAIALLLRTRSTQLNRTADMAITYGTGIQTIRPVTDDQGTRNDVTARNADGTEAQAVAATGTLSVLEPPDGVGRYQATVDVNVDLGSVDLADVAGWWKNKGTVDVPRYPVVTIDLDANASLKTAAERLNAGDRVTVAGLEYDTVDLRVLGGSETIGTHRRTISLLCDPGQQWLTGIYDGTARRYDSATTTVVASKTTTATSWGITTTAFGDVWSTTSTPYDWVVAGERVTVTAMSAAAGSGPYTQTATVARSVNGVVKTHAAGEQIHIATPGRYGL